MKRVRVTGELALAEQYADFDTGPKKGNRYVTVDDYGRFLNIAELKELLRERGLKVGGTKTELVQRLQASDAYGNEAVKAAHKHGARKPQSKTAAKKKKAPAVWLTMYDYGRDDITTLQESCRARGLSDVGQKRTLENRLSQADLDGINDPRPVSERRPKSGKSSSEKENVPPTPSVPAKNYQSQNPPPILPPLRPSNGNAGPATGNRISLPAVYPSIVANQPSLPAVPPSVVGNQPSLPAVPPRIDENQPSLPAVLPRVVGNQPASAGFPTNVNYNANSTQPMGDPLPTYDGWTQPQLKEELKSREMRVSGSVPQLRERLRQADLESSLFHKQAMESAAKAKRERNAGMRGPNWKKPDILESIKRHDKKLDECVRRGPDGKPVYDDMGYELSYEKCSKQSKSFPRRGQRNFEKEEAEWAKELEKERKMYEIMGGLNRDLVNSDRLEWRVAKDLQIPYHKVELRDCEEWKRRGFSVANEAELQKLPKEESELLLDMMSGSAYRK